MVEKLVGLVVKVGRRSFLSKLLQGIELGNGKIQKERVNSCQQCEGNGQMFFGRIVGDGRTDDANAGGTK